MRATLADRPSVCIQEVVPGFLHRVQDLQKRAAGVRRAATGHQHTTVGYGSGSRRCGSHEGDEELAAHSLQLVHPHIFLEKRDAVVGGCAKRKNQKQYIIEKVVELLVGGDDDHSALNSFYPEFSPECVKLELKKK